MKRLTVRSCRIGSTSALCLVAALRLSAQAAAPAADANSGTNDEAVQLSPFVVDATEDSDTYSAKDTLAGTRVRTELKDVASSISVVTTQFLEDTGSKNSQDLLVYTPSTEVAGLKGNFSGQGGNVQYSENTTNPNNNTRVRGLDAADNTRDYFLTDIPWDSFNVGRVDLQRGPNSILFGVGSPAGIINSSLNTAGFKNAYHVENVTSQYGSQRQVVDFNFALIPDTLAIRFAMVDDKEEYQQKPAFNNSRRYYGALRFDPKLFGEGNQTSIRANIEHGSVSSNNPRIIPPDDQLTRFFQTGTDAYGNPGLNQATLNSYAYQQGAGQTISNALYPTKGWQQGRLYWPTDVAYYNGSDPHTPGVAPTVSSSVPTMEIYGQIPTGWAINAQGQIAPPNQPGQSTNIGIGGLPSVTQFALEPFADYAATSIAGGTYYANKVLTDPSIFNFYDMLLDGPNKREWQNWDSYNVALSQTFLNGRVGFEAAYDKQSYSNGSIAALTGGGYGIGIDVNQVLPNGVANPNVGRPYVANAFDYSSNSSKTERDSSRLTAFGELRAEDFLQKSWLTRILGRHVFTGLLALDHKSQQNVSWSQYAATPQVEADNNFDLSVRLANYRLYNFVDYIGPTLLGASSAANAHLTNVQNIIAPTNSNVTWFDSHWKYSLEPSNPNYVDPNALYTYTDQNLGTTVTSTQSNNPANYVGWSHLPVTWMNAANPADFPSLVTGGQKSKFRDRSEALIYQGYFLDGDLVPTYGWRKDSISNYLTGAPINQATGISAYDYTDDPSSLKTTVGQTRTWGAVYHFPKVLMKNLPYDTGFSVFYNNSHNFKADAPRTNIAGEQIPNPDGVTKEYGAVLTTLSDKISLKVTHYQTTVHWATLNTDALAGLGGLGYLLDLIPAWGYGYAGQVQMGLDGAYGNTTLTGTGDQSAGGTPWNYVAKDAVTANSAADLSVIGTPAGAANVPVSTYGYGGTGTVSMKDIVNAWLNMPIPTNFFDYYGISGNRPIPSLMRSTGKIYLGFSTPAVGDNLPGVGGQQPSGGGNAVSTVDNVSQGWEYELTAHPTKNWNITVNYTKVQATKNNIDAITQKFMADNLAFYQGPGGQLRLWGASQTAGYGASTTNATAPFFTYPFSPGQSNGSTVGPQWITGVYDPYLVVANAQGQSAPEVSPWRLNLINTYSFDHGFVKGSFVGGALRMEAGRILGYKYSPTLQTLDVTQVLVGPNDKYVDLWVGYKKTFQLGRKIEWRIQLNLRNVGTKAHLVAARYEPDGSLALARIEDGMGWSLTNAFDF